MQAEMGCKQNYGETRESWPDSLRPKRPKPGKIKKRKKAGQAYTIQNRK
jgi:hypothetical protein